MKKIISTLIAVVCGVATTASAFYVNFDGAAADGNLIETAANWANGTLPNSTTITGVVRTGWNTTMKTNDAFAGKSIIFEGNSTVTNNSAAARVGKGATLLFKDSSRYSTVMGLDIGHGSVGTVTVQDSAEIRVQNLLVLSFAGSALNQKGGTVIAGKTLALDAGSYNLVNGTLFVGGVKPGGIVWGSGKLNFVSGGSGKVTINVANYDFAAQITAGKILIDGAPAGISSFQIDTSVAGKTTLSLAPKKPVTIVG